MKTRSQSDQAAFTLVEVSIALGIVAFCLVPLIAILPIGLKNDETAIEQTSANAILSAVAADLRTTARTAPAGGSATTPQFSIPVPANPVAAAPAATTLYFTSDGTFIAPPLTSTPPAGARYLMTVQFPTNVPTLPTPAPPSGTLPKTATFANLQVSWPASAAPANASGTAQTFVALNRN